MFNKNCKTSFPALFEFRKLFKKFLKWNRDFAWNVLSKYKSNADKNTDNMIKKPVIPPVKTVYRKDYQLFHFSAVWNWLELRIFLFQIQFVFLRRFPQAENISFYDNQSNDVRFRLRGPGRSRLDPSLYCRGLGYLIASILDIQSYLKPPINLIFTCCLCTVSGKWQESDTFANAAIASSRRLYSLASASKRVRLDSIGWIGENGFGWNVSHDDNLNNVFIIP